MQQSYCFLLLPHSKAILARHPPHFCSAVYSFGEYQGDTTKNLWEVAIALEHSGNLKTARIISSLCFILIAILWSEYPL